MIGQEIGKILNIISLKQMNKVGYTTFKAFVMGERDASLVSCFCMKEQTVV